MQSAITVTFLILPNTSQNTKRTNFTSFSAINSTTSDIEYFISYPLSDNALTRKGALSNDAAF